MKNHLKTSFDYIRREPFQALAAISVLVITFSVSTFMVILVYSSNQIIRYFETRPQVIAFLKDDAEPKDIDDLRSKLASDERINSVNFVSKEEALNIYKKSTSDNPLLGELVSPSIFPASIEFSVSNLGYAQQIIDEIRENPVVDSVSFTANLGGESKLGEVINRLKKISYYLRLTGLTVVSVLAVTSFLVLMVVVGMRITVRRSEIESLSLIGATNWFIRAPIVFEVLDYVFIGVTIGWLSATVLLMYATPSILRFFGDIPILPKNTPAFFTLLGAIYFVELFVGTIIALLGSFLAVSRSLRMIK